MQPYPLKEPTYPRPDAPLRLAQTPESSPVLISLIMAVRNRVQCLQRCLDSVAAQTASDFELVVVDGASTDGTKELIERNGHVVARWISASDSGPYDAWNKALPLARGKWIGFLGSDDRLASRTVMRRLSDVAAHAPDHVDLIYGNVVYLRNGHPAGCKGRSYRNPRRFPYRHLCCSLTVAHPLALHRRSVFDQNGVFDPEYRIAGDTEFLLRFLADDNVLYLPGLTTVEMDTSGLSGADERAIDLVHEVARLRRHHGLPLALSWYLQWCKAHMKGGATARRLGAAWLVRHLRHLRQFARYGLRLPR